MIERYLAELVILIFVSGYFGLSAHEMLHYYVASKWTNGAEIGFDKWVKTPSKVTLEDYYDLTADQIRKYCAAPAVTWGVVLILTIAIAPNIHTWYQFPLYFGLIVAALPSPCDLFGVLYPVEFQAKATEKEFSNLDAIRYIFNTYKTDP